MIQLIRMRFLHLKYFNVIYTELKENTISLSLRPTDSYQPHLLIVHGTKPCLPVPGALTHLWEAKTDLCDFKASLVYIESSKTTRAI